MVCLTSIARPSKADRLAVRINLQVIGKTEDVASVMSALAAIAEGVDISFRTRPMLADEMVLEAALNGRAEAIVTHNVKNFRPALKLGATMITSGEIVMGPNI